MGYLLTQMFLYLLGAFALGVLLGWILWGYLRSLATTLEVANAKLQADTDRLRGELDTCRAACADLERRMRKPEPVEPPVNIPQPQAVEPPDLVAVPDIEPQTLASRPKASKGKKQPLPVETAIPDDLRRIIGIGPVNEKKLHDIGVTSFAQIADWTSADIDRVERVLEFDGRIDRERWIEQAALLAAGDEEEFARRFPTAGTSDNS